MAEYIAVCLLSDLPQGSTKCVRVGDHRIALYNLDGEVYATQEFCTHAEASLCDGDISGDEIMCPLHFATFNIRTGECTGPPADEDLKTYPVKVEDEQIFVQVE